MPKIRELKQDMEIIEIKPDTRLADISEKMSAKEIEQSIMGLVKTQHHHADGSEVRLEVVHAEEEEFQRKAARDSPKGRNLDTLVQENLPKDRQTEDEEQRKVSLKQGTWGGNYKAMEDGDSSTLYQRDSGVDVQCNCGQQFHFGGAGQQPQTTAEKMDATKTRYAAGTGGTADRQQYTSGGHQSYESGTDRSSNYRR